MIKGYHSSALIGFQKKAIAQAGGKFQEALMRAALQQQGGDFVDWLEGELRASKESGGPLTTDGDELPLPAFPLHYSASDFKRPTQEAGDAIWQVWQHVNPGIFSSSTVWAYIVACMIREQRIAPHYLMAGRNGNDTDGRREIELALNAKGEKRRDALDKCTRNFLRRLSGLQIVRGTRSVMQNCPPAVAWWQRHIADDVARYTELDAGAVWQLFNHSPAVWEAFSDKMASQLTIIGDRNIRNGLLLFFMEKSDQEKNKLLKKECLVAIFRAVGIMCGWRAVGFMSPESVSAKIKRDIMPHLSHITTAGEGNGGSHQTENIN